MNQNTPQDHISQKVVLYSIPGMDAVSVRRDLAYPADGSGARALDIYYPPRLDSGRRVPAVVIVAGYPDPGFERAVGCKFKEMGSTVSWARLLAASGLAAITYANREPRADLHALLRHLRQEAAALRLDADKLGLWASSGNVPLALSALMREGGALKCAALCYGYTLDLDGRAAVADAAANFGFANPPAGKTVADLPHGSPLFIARAGRDQMPGLNDTLDRFLAAALTHNLPLTLVNHPHAPHAFDLFHDSPETRAAVRQLLAFLRAQLLTFHARGRA